MKILFTLTTLLALQNSYGSSKKLKHYSNQFNHIHAPEPTSTALPKKIWESDANQSKDQGPIKVVLYNQETGEIIGNPSIKKTPLPVPPAPQSTPTQSEIKPKIHSPSFQVSYVSKTLKSDYTLESDDEDDAIYETIHPQSGASQLYPTLPQSLPMAIPSSSRSFSLTTCHDESSSDYSHTDQLFTPSAPPASAVFYSTPKKTHQRQRSASDGTIEKISHNTCYDPAPPYYEDSGLKRTQTNPLLNFTEKKAEEIQKSLERLQKDLDEKIKEIEALKETPYEDRQASFLQRVFLSREKQEAKSLKKQDNERQKKIDPLQNEAIKLASTIAAIKKKLGKQ